MIPLSKQEYIDHRLKKSADSLLAAKLLFQNNFLNETINRLYYGCFYIVTALLFKKDIKSKTHAGALNMFSLHFIKPNLLPESMGDFYTSLFNNRQEGDYADFSEFEKTFVETLLAETEDFISAVKILIGE